MPTGLYSQSQLIPYRSYPLLQSKKLNHFDLKNSSKNLTYIFNTNQLPIFYEQADANSNFSVKANWIKINGISLTNIEGNNITIGLWDQGTPLTTHQELTGRIFPSDTASSFPSNSHSTQVAGIAIGTGVVAQSIGIASSAIINSYDWSNDIQELSNAAANGLKISVHPYVESTGWYYNWFNDNKWVWYADTTANEIENASFGYYNEFAQAIDEIAVNYPYLSIIRAAGNFRGKGPVTQPQQHWIPYYDEIAESWSWKLSSTIRDINGGESGFESLSHASVSKNSIVVANVFNITTPDSSNVAVITTDSSFGPTDDGRIKPDISAPGQNIYMPTNSGNSTYSTSSGTSFAAGLVSGVIASIRSNFEHNLQTIPTSSLVKALIIHTATEAGNNPGPDYQFGWGVVNLEKSIRYSNSFKNGNRFINLIDTTLTNNQEINISYNKITTNPIKITIVWNDPASTPNQNRFNPTESSLINDLDIRLYDANLAVYYPWILDRNNPGNAAIQGDNTVDNVEQIDANPPIGQLTLKVTHKGNLTADQPLSIIYSEGEPHSEYTISGSSGWQLLALPVNTTVNELSLQAHIQGVTGLLNYSTSSPNLFTQFINNTWNQPENANEIIYKGNGFIQYIYDNNITPNAKLPLNIASNSKFDTSSTSVVLSNKTGFNMLGNPFDKPINLGDIYGFNGIITDIAWIWDNNSGWVAKSRAANDLLPAYHGFFLETTSVDSVMIPFYSRQNMTQEKNSIRNDIAKIKLVEKNGNSFNPKDAGIRIYLGEQIADSLIYIVKKPSPLSFSSTRLSLINDKSMLDQSEYFQFYLDQNRDESHFTVQLKSEEKAYYSAEILFPNSLYELDISGIPYQIKSQGDNNDTQLVELDFTNPQQFTDNNYSTLFSIRIKQRNLTTSKSNIETSPARLLEASLYPNPFNPTGSIKIKNKSLQKVQVTVYDINGREILTVFDDNLAIGVYNFSINTSRWSSGVYFIKVHFSNEILVLPLTLVK